MLEREIEKHLKTEVEKCGGRCLKLVSPGVRGVPDRVIIKEGGEVFFVELKREGGVLSPLQKKMIGELRGQGVKVYVLEGMDQVEGFLNEAIR